MFNPREREAASGGEKRTEKGGEQTIGDRENHRKAL